MHLHPEEPEARSWEQLERAELADRVRALLPAHRALVLVDGRSGSGKSTLAESLARLLDGATVVHTDDIAWNHDRFGWAEDLFDGVLAPWRLGESVCFRPPGWVAGDRPGAVEVPACPVLVVEGVGAGRATLAAVSDLAVWVQSDREEARRRGLARDVVLGRTPREAEEFWDGWMRAEEPFLADDRPWRRAGLVVNGTPPAAAGTATLISEPRRRRGT